MPLLGLALVSMLFAQAVSIWIQCLVRMQIPDSVSMNYPDSVSIPYPGSVLESHPGQSPGFFPSIQSLDFPSRNAVASRNFVGQFHAPQMALYVPQSFCRHVLQFVQNVLLQSAHWILRLCLILSV